MNENCTEGAWVFFIFDVLNSLWGPISANVVSRGGTKVSLWEFGQPFLF